MTGAPVHLYHGAVSHRRLRPVGHRFVYKVFSILVDLDRLDEAAQSSRWFSLNKFNLFSFHDADHAFKTGETVSRSVRKLLRQHGYCGDGRIELLCYPRVLGYVFNPLSIFYCRDARDRLEAVIYEVRNTFGGRHSYLIGADGAGRVIRQSADKVFHVSPFMEMEHIYDFRLTPPRDIVSVFIRQRDREGPIFNAAFAGRAEAATDAAWLKAFLRYPLMTLKIIAAIHFEAGRLFLKGLRLKGRGPDPASPVSAIGGVRRLRRQSKAM
ncbi:MAG TPA: DUF1365 domain-containing protein [Parvularcula sp.]|nr:DUF1365 domain-containing protein [Parvularcula sp.]HBS34880.1 DUF1365 domain-containing protein [Parvularcula sp.]